MAKKKKCRAPSKTPYATWLLAMKAVARGAYGATVYRCSCGKFHTTSQVRRKR